MTEHESTGCKCFLPSCLRTGPIRTFKLKGIKTLIECAAERNDQETLTKMQATLDSEGEQASVSLHKGVIAHTHPGIT